MEKRPIQSFLVAAKYDFLSEHMKSGSFIYVNFSHVKHEVNIEEENIIYSTSANEENMISVSADKPFRCEGFTCKSHLKTHQGSHTGDKLYVYDTCDKYFMYKCHLKSHWRIHTGDLYVCDTCGKGFTCKSKLKRHQRIHTENKLYVCDTCDKCFCV